MEEAAWPSQSVPPDSGRVVALEAGCAVPQSCAGPPAGAGRAGQRARVVPGHGGGGAASAPSPPPWLPINRRLPGGRDVREPPDVCDGGREEGDGAAWGRGGAVMPRSVENRAVFQRARERGACRLPVWWAGTHPQTNGPLDAGGLGRGGGGSLPARALRTWSQFKVYEDGCSADVLSRVLFTCAWFQAAAGSCSWGGGRGETADAREAWMASSSSMLVLYQASTLVLMAW